MSQYFADFDVEQFWKPSEYAEKEYVGTPLTDEVVAAVERECRGLQAPGFLRQADEVPERRYPTEDEPPDQRANFVGERPHRHHRHFLDRQREILLTVRPDSGASSGSMNGGIRQLACTSPTARPRVMTWSAWIIGSVDTAASRRSSTSIRSGTTRSHSLRRASKPSSGAWRMTRRSRKVRDRP